MVVDPARRGLFQRLVALLTQPFLSRVWFVGSPVVLFLQAPPAMCLHTLKAAAKPKVNQLHLRKLYEDGRRYFIQPVAQGFKLTTTSKVVWHYRKRTSASTVINARFVPLDDRITRIYLRGRINPFALLTNPSFLMPFFMTSILIYIPWHPLVIFTAIVVLFGLAWVSHRSNAHLEVHEMTWFVQTALEDLVPGEIMSLNEGAEDIIYEREEFEQAWDRFYREHRNES